MSKNKHHVAIALIEEGIRAKVEERESVNTHYRYQTQWLERLDKEIASLQHTREVLVLVGQGG